VAKIFIDGKEYDVDEKKNLLEVCLSLELDLPYFCWHPAMDSVGACRQCAVSMFKDENDKDGKLVMACMEPAKEGTRISLEHPEARTFRKEVIEWLMTNHPHDCPVCDEGGECHLQDMTVMTGHDYRRFRFNKRTYKNQYLGPFINHEMNRCIQCYRCVRFYRDYAGGNDLDVFSAHNHVYFGRHEDGVLENEFSGNLVEVCPTGVFTDKTLKKHYTRKWDLTTAPSICTQCGLGCNIIPGERYGGLRRVMGRYNGEVNGYFICDRGRFGYEYVNSEKRVREILHKKNDGNLEKVNSVQALNAIRGMLKEKAIGIGSPRASLESNFALRNLVGKDNFYSGMNKAEQELTNLSLEILQKGPVAAASLKDIREADAVLVLGEDLTNTAPMMALAVRQAVKNKPKQKLAELGIQEWHAEAAKEAIQDERGPLYLATPAQTKLENISTETLHAAPADITRLGFAVARALDKNAPDAQGGKEYEKLASQIAAALRDSAKPVIISGFGCGDAGVMMAAANVAKALQQHQPKTRIALSVPENNSIGNALLAGDELEAVFARAEKGEVKTVVVLENDLYRRADKEKIDAFLKKCKNVIVLDHLKNRTAQKADWLLPAATFAEADGTFVNNEGRAQRFFKVFAETEDSTSASWRWLTKLALEKALSHQALLEKMISEMPQLSAIKDIAPPPGFRVNGQKLPRESHRYSGRTAMHANKDVNEPKPPQDEESPFSFTMEGYHGKPPSSAIPFFWSPGWNSVQSINKYQIEVGGPLHGGDPGKRLFKGGKNGDFKYFENSPAGPERKKGQWLAVPGWHIFGSEELSVHTEGLAERMPQPYVKINSKDAEGLGLKAGGTVSLKSENAHLKVELSIDNALPDGLAVIPAGLPGMDFMALPGIVTIEK